MGWEVRHKQKLYHISIPNRCQQGPIGRLWAPIEIQLASTGTYGTSTVHVVTPLLKDSLTACRVRRIKKAESDLGEAEAGPIDVTRPKR